MSCVPDICRSFSSYTGFARRGTHLYAYGYALSRGIEKNIKTPLYFLFRHIRNWNQPSVCTIILVTLCNFGIVIWTQLKILGHFLVFSHTTPCEKETNMAVKKLLDMTSHENPLLNMHFAYVFRFYDFGVVICRTIVLDNAWRLYMLCVTLFWHPRIYIRNKVYLQIFQRSGEIGLRFIRNKIGIGIGVGVGVRVEFFALPSG